MAKNNKLDKNLEQSEEFKINNNIYFNTISQDIKRYYLITLLTLKKKRKLLLDKDIKFVTQKDIINTIAIITNIPIDLIKKVMINIIPFDENQKIYIDELLTMEKILLLNDLSFPSFDNDYSESSLNIIIAKDYFNFIESFKQKKVGLYSLLFNMYEKEEIEEIVQKTTPSRYLKQLMKEYEFENIEDIAYLYAQNWLAPTPDEEIKKIFPEMKDGDKEDEEKLKSIYELSKLDLVQIKTIYHDILNIRKKYNLENIEKFLTEKFQTKNEIEILIHLADKKFESYSKTLEIFEKEKSSLTTLEKISVLRYLGILLNTIMTLFEKLIFELEYLKFMKTYLINTYQIQIGNSFKFAEYNYDYINGRPFGKGVANLSNIGEETEIRRMFELQIFKETKYINYPEKYRRIGYFEENFEDIKSFKWIQNFEDRVNIYVAELDSKQKACEYFEDIMEIEDQLSKKEFDECVDLKYSIYRMEAYLYQVYDTSRKYTKSLELILKNGYDLKNARELLDSATKKNIINAQLKFNKMYIIPRIIKAENDPTREHAISIPEERKNVFIYDSIVEKMEYEEYGKMNERMTKEYDKIKKKKQEEQYAEESKIVEEYNKNVKDKDLKIVTKETINDPDELIRLKALLDEGDEEKIAEHNRKMLEMLPEEVRQQVIDLTNANMKTLGLDGKKMTGEIPIPENLDETLRKLEQEKIDKKNYLLKFSQNLNEKAKSGELDELIGREEEVERVIEILNRRSKNNPVLLGEAGVGKTAIAQGLAQKIIEGKVPEKLKAKEILLLDLPSVVAGTQYRGQFEERIKNIIDICEKLENIILVIDEIHTISSTGAGSDSESTSTAGNLLKPALSNGKVQILGTTTIREYKKFIEKDKALERRFQTIIVQEPKEEEAIKIISGIAKYYENHYYVEIPQETIVSAVKLSKRYISNRYLPDKAIDILDEACSRKSLNDEKTNKYEKEIIKLHKIDKELETLEKIYNDIQKQKMVSEKFVKDDPKEEARRNTENIVKEKMEKYNAEKAAQEKVVEKIQKNYTRLKIETVDIAKIVERWTKIPVSKLTEEETQKILNLEKTLEERVIGQKEAIVSIVKAIKRNRAGIKSSNRPPSFLFVGPTGVGKTELAKTLSRELFGDTNKMVRIDMSEYSEEHSSSKLIGAPPGYVGYDEGGQLTEKIRRNPYSVILFDEIEKAHPKVLNVLLQVLDDGKLTDAQGTLVNFEHTIIIMTSNAGSNLNLNNIGFGKEEEQRKDKTLEGVRNVFRPEFLNRFDSIVVFKQLTKENLKLVVTIFLKETEKALEKYEIKLNITEEAKEYLIDNGTDLKYGARPLKRAVQKFIEDPIADMILENKFKYSSTLNVSYNKKEDKLDFKF